MLDAIINFFKAIWNWIKSLFGDTDPKKPVVRITILALLLIAMFIPNDAFAQRTELQSIYVYFYQPLISSSTSWTVTWHGTDSLDIYRNDTLKVKIRNEQGQWVNWIDIQQEQDTMLVGLLIDQPFSFDTEITFDILARDSLGNPSPDSVTATSYFIVSDINKINNSNVEQGYILGDTRVDGLDLIELSRYWGQQVSTYVDLTGDGRVDGLDLIQMSKDWGRSH